MPAGSLSNLFDVVTKSMDFPLLPNGTSALLPGSAVDCTNFALFFLNGNDNSRAFNLEKMKHVAPIAFSDMLMIKPSNAVGGNLSIEGQFVLKNRRDVWSNHRDKRALNHFANLVLNDRLNNFQTIFLSSSHGFGELPCLVRRDLPRQWWFIRVDHRFDQDRSRLCKSFL